MTRNTGTGGRQEMNCGADQLHISLVAVNLKSEMLHHTFSETNQKIAVLHNLETQSGCWATRGHSRCGILESQSLE